MKPEYASVYRSLYLEHWWWRARETLLVGEIERHLPAAGWGPILDVGCGDGLFFARLERFGEPWGVEVDPSLVADDGPYRSRIHVGRFDDTYQPASRFGLVLMLDVLEHLEQPERALHQARELLAPEACLLITVPAFRLLWTGHDDLNQHVTRYTRSSLKAVIRAAGLIPLSFRYFFHWLFPVKLAVRAGEALLRSSPTPATIPPAWVNAALYRFSLMEGASVGRLHLPFGSSLLAWCMRGAPATEADGVLPTVAGASLPLAVGD